MNGDRAKDARFVMPGVRVPADYYPRTQLNDALIASCVVPEVKTAARCEAHNFMSESRKARRPRRMALFKLDLPLSVLSWVYSN